MRVVGGCRGANVSWFSILVHYRVHPKHDGLGEHGIDLEPRDAQTSNEKLVHQVIAAAEFLADS